MAVKSGIGAVFGVMGDMLSGKVGIGAGVKKLYEDAKTLTGLAAGAGIGMVVGGALGTIFPVVGNIIGAAVGAVVGLAVAGTAMVALEALRVSRDAAKAGGKKIGEVIDAKLEANKIKDARKHELEMKKIEVASSKEVAPSKTADSNVSAETPAIDESSPVFTVQRDTQRSSLARQKSANSHDQLNKPADNTLNVQEAVKHKSLK